jgi:hypothetical protein
VPFDGHRLKLGQRSAVGPNAGAGVKVMTVRHDIGIITGEEAVLLILARSPVFL